MGWVNASSSASSFDERYNGEVRDNTARRQAMQAIPICDRAKSKCERRMCYILERRCMLSGLRSIMGEEVHSTCRVFEGSVAKRGIRREPESLSDVRASTLGADNESPAVARGCQVRKGKVGSNHVDPTGRRRPGVG